jgi:glycogen phosphorylase
MEPRTVYHLEVNPKVPPRLARLEELASNLWYSWDRPTRTLFSRLHTGLWDAVGHNPKAFLRRVDEQVLLDAADDSVFLANYNRVLSAYDTYHSEPLRRNGSEWLRSTDKVAYFCAEFGFHESFPIYSGGLGILAGDHCKAASDMRLPFVGVGLLYRQGYFSQSIDTEGNQRAVYTDSEFESLPVAPVRTIEGADLKVHVDLPGRRVACKVWQAQCGHVQLYLLDTDLEENDEHGRNITHQLYGGDRHMRIEQEIVLGIGGVRALEALQVKPTVWHINEGHAAFLVLERMRALVRQGADRDTALEAVAANTVFTTHTPVPAGHDHFAEDMIWSYFQAFCGELGMSREEFLALGRKDDQREFNMTALAIHASRFQNGVSRIHGGVSSRICADMWPQVDARDNSIGYITNGVHVPTFLAQEWAEVFEKHLGFDWTQRLTDSSFWQRVDEIPDHVFWSVRQSLKSAMLHLVRFRVSRQHFRNHGSEAHLDRLLKLADPGNPNVLTLGFARRFATYKRATLLFEDLRWLEQILCNPAQPVLLIFAGKAHPADQPGQELIRRVTQVAALPQFEGRILMVEDYDLRLARRLVSGVDVWLNNPTYPLEASGTSGMKAGMNGVLNLSVLDGWWDEGYDGKNGWAIKPVSESFEPERRSREEAKALYELLQDQVIPMYYRRGDVGHSTEWIGMAKRSIATLLPRFSSTRMVGEYLAKFYLPASRQGRRYVENGLDTARRIAAWKSHVRKSWDAVRMRRIDAPRRNILYGESVRFEVAVFLDGLKPDDVVVEMLVGRQTEWERLRENRRYRFEWEGIMTEQGEHRFVLQLTPEICGKLEYRVRVYPWHENLTHPFEMGMMRWL